MTVKLLVLAPKFMGPKYVLVTALEHVPPDAEIIFPVLRKLPWPSVPTCIVRLKVQPVLYVSGPENCGFPFAIFEMDSVPFVFKSPPLTVIVPELLPPLLLNVYVSPAAYAFFGCNKADPPKLHAKTANTKNNKIRDFMFPAKRIFYMYYA